MEALSTGANPEKSRMRGLFEVPNKWTQLHRPKWKNPEQSVGRFCRKHGSLSYWEAEGPALSAFHELASEIRRHLKCLGDTATETILWCLYMVGKSKRTAIPTVFFCSRNADARQDVRKSIDESGILDLYPGFKTADASCPPGFDQLKQLATGTQGFPQSKWSSYLDCENAIGRSITVTQTQASGVQSVARATIGALFQHRDDLLFATAAHSLLPEGFSLDLSSDSPSDFEYNVDDDYPSDDSDDNVEDHYPSDDRELSTISSATIPQRSTGVSTDSKVVDKGDDDMESIEDEGKPSFRNTKSSCTYGADDITFLSTPALDFCLLPLKENLKGDMGLSIRGMGSGAHCPHVVLPVCAVGRGSPGPVVAYTGSEGVRYGTLSGTPSFMIPAGETSSQELWSVHFDKELHNGDCGSLVVSERTGELEGHIIAGSPGTGLAYIVPAQDMLKHIQTSYSKDCRLTTHPINRTLPEALNTEFSRLLSLKRKQSLLMQDHNTSINQKLYNIPVYPKPPSTPSAQRFWSVLNSQSEVPLGWESPTLLETALLIIPVELIRREAQEEYLFTKESRNLDREKMTTWGLQDCLVRSLLKWFKDDFFNWVGEPACSVCGSRTNAQGMVLPLAEEAAHGANQVELYRCQQASCGADERFPRYKDVLMLLSTRRGRTGEWALCFAMLCRAIGARVRLVWNTEGDMWTEVYSEYHRKWIHVDASEGEWNQPLLYTEVRKRKMSYCIAFSVDGPTDVTRRYVRSSTCALPRGRASEAELFYMLDEIRNERRADLGTQERARLKEEGMEEERELRAYIAEKVGHDFCRIRLPGTEVEKHLPIEEITRRSQLSSRLFAKTERLEGRGEVI